MKQDLDISNVEGKRPYPNRVVKSKYDAVVFELKMAQTALDNRNKDIDGWVKQNNELRAEVERLRGENADLKKDNDIWRKAGRETEEQKNRAIAIIEKQKSEIIQSDNSWEAIISAYNALSKEVDDAKDERDLLKHKCAELNKAYHEAKTDRDVLIAKATEHAHLDSLARKLRDQRDQARFFAALFGFAAFLFGLAALGLAVAVLVGRLVPVVNLD